MPQINSMDQPYDYESVMHYGPRAYSRNQERTIEARKDQAIGRLGGLSVGDILQANLLYKCTRTGGGLLTIIFKSRTS